MIIRYLFCVFLLLSMSLHADVLQVHGRFLTTPCGDTIILRGLNKQCIFESNNYGIPMMPDIRKTGANVLRIVWNTTEAGSTAANLDKVIQACIDNAMIPMVEMHDATGDITKMDVVVAYWMRADILSVVKKHEKYLLINVANEPGDFEVTHDKYYNINSLVIKNFRQNGVTAPLIFDATGYGQDIDQILYNAASLLSNDPNKNLMFSLHAYWDPKYFPNPAQLFSDKMTLIVDQNIPLIIGEFTGCYTDDPNSTDDLWKTILPVCQANKIGWLAWEWGPGNADYSKDPPIPYPKMDMSGDGTYDGIKDGWAKDVLLNHDASIAKTSVTSDYIKRKGLCLNADVSPIESSNSDVLWPNPVSHDLSIALSTPSAIRIEDALGQLVLSQELRPNESHHQFDCSTFSTGVYYVHYTNSGIHRAMRFVVAR